MNTTSPRLFTALLLLAGSTVAPAAERCISERLYLSGHGKDDAVLWQFKCDQGNHAGEWTTIPVPSSWELQGFGIYNYGHDMGSPKSATQPVRTDKKGNVIPPFKPAVVGHYKHKFQIAAAWQGRRVFIVFDGSQTDTEVCINGQPAGPKHQGGFYRFEYEVTSLLKFGSENLIEATVSDESSDPWVNRAERRGDYWNYGGICRPVYLESRPPQFIERVAIDAKADGSMTVDVYPIVNGQGSPAAPPRDPVSNQDVYLLEAQVKTLDGKPLGDAMKGSIVDGPALPGGGAARLPVARLAGKCQNVLSWTAETPNLYNLEVRLKRGDQVLHQYTQRFGFRTIEVKLGDGVYVNGKRILLKGCCRHTFWPDSGKCTSEKVSELDVNLMKDMNMNAVRMSHYPPDEHFLDKCDELGLYVLDELAGWQGDYSTEAGRQLIGQMIKRDVNHPSILFWDNGNEGGWNTELDGDYAQWDPQKRHVLHPWELHDGIDTKHYPSFKTLQEKLAGPNIYFPTECLHGLYDGGGGAKLQEYWDAIRTSKVGGGAFIWAYLDEAVVRSDKDGILDSHGNHAPDGLVGPYREKEGSFYTVKEVWSPVVVHEPKFGEQFDGTLEVENRYEFTDLRQCKFSCEFRKPHEPWVPQNGMAVVHEFRRIEAPAVPPGTTGRIVLPPEVRAIAREAGGSMVLAVRVADPLGRELWTWVWPVGPKGAVVVVPPAHPGPPVEATEQGDKVRLSARDLSATFNQKDGLLESVSRAGKTFSFGNGPRPAVGTAEFVRSEHKAGGDSNTVIARYNRALTSTQWTLRPDGWLRLDYEYNIDAKTQTHLAGITFNYPEKNVKSKKWLGNGPFRVWQNRMQGGTLNVWETKYNDTITGQTYDYPEFKGFFSKVRWMRLETTEGPITMVLGSDDLFVRLFTPTEPKEPGQTHVDFPPGDISILHAIPPIGDKFRKPDPTPYAAPGTYKGTVWFYFGE